MHRLTAVLVVLSVLFISTVGCSREAKEKPLDLPETIEVFEAMDTPNDSGMSILLRWNRVRGDSAAVQYLIEVGESATGPFLPAATIPAGEGSLCLAAPQYFGFDEENKKFRFAQLRLVPELPLKEMGKGKFKGEDGKEYFFRLTRFDGSARFVYPGIVSATAGGNWFNTAKLNNFLLAIIFCGTVMLFINLAKRNPNLFIRKIAGLDAVEEAIGRATEMGRPIFFVPGIGPMSVLPTIAAVNILQRVARKVAEHDTILRVPNRDPIVMSVCQEVVKEACTSVGRPDAYREENVFFITQDQFAYTAAVDGMMVREKPATNFFMGMFFAESLLLAEVGASIGAIQIAGTDSYAQLPFFITTCDYTLIGEELYAASAYLSREANLLGSLRGQDVGKAFLIFIIIVGLIVTSAGSKLMVNFLTEF